MAVKVTGSLTIGLDIGIASVGWAVLAPDRIVALGVRAFDKAETAKEGASLNLVRRTARLTRRRIHRRAWRLTKLARLLKRQGVIDDTRMFQPQRPFPHSLWRLRVEGLDRQLNAEEWARVIYHLCKHRGFHWISRAEEKKAEADTKGEGGKVKQGLAATKKLMQEKGYRSASEMVLMEFPEAQRNKQGDYGKALSRISLGEELADLFRRQRELGNAHAGAELEAAILGSGDRKTGLFWAQKPALAGEALLKMLGKCTFERDEYRAPKASFTAERHVWLTRLNNLRINVDGVIRPLQEAERQVVLPLPYLQAGNFTYKQLHDALVKKGLLPQSFDFVGLRSTKDKDPLKETLVKLPAWQELRKAIEGAGLKSEWQKISGDALESKPDLLDKIAWILSVYKEDEETERELRRLDLPNAEETVAALLSFSRSSFSGFHALSLTALRKIVPRMESGLRYDEAVADISEYGHHSQLLKSADEKNDYLPPLYEHHRDKESRNRNKMLFNKRVEQEIQGGIPRNPVVLRAINQGRKVLNAIIREYGSPYAVHIELARDLSRPLVGHKDKHGNYIKGRRDIENEQVENRARNETDWQEYVAYAPSFSAVGSPNGRDFEKWQLYRQQDGKCPYCLGRIDSDRLLEPKYVEVDHALPRSRSFDNGRNNKVLVHTHENQNKGNRTPHEYFQELDGSVDGPLWRHFEAFVKTNPKYPTPKKERLLRKNFGEKEARDFSERNLYDTRYIGKFFKSYVERYLKLADDSDSKRCVVLSGQLTAFLRRRWGLPKLRSESDRHHALDAAVVAACSHGMVKRLSDYSRRKELAQVREGFVDVETGEIVNSAMFQQVRQHFPDPWPNFRHELEARLKIDDPAMLRAEIGRLGNYPPGALNALQPLFVSRAPKRRDGGELHQDTIRSAKLLDQGLSYVSVPLQKLRLTDLDKIVGAGDPRNASLIDALRKRLHAHDGDGKKAFSTPVFKPSAPGSQAPLVRTVKLSSTQKGGVRVRGGVADQGEMLHVNVYRHKERFLIEPAYGIDAEKHLSLPEIPAEAEFLFALSKNDYVKVVLGDATHEGYFVMYESDGRITLRAHDQPKPDKDYFRKGVVNASRIEKFDVDVLGNRYPARPEKRRGLA